MGHFQPDVTYLWHVRWCLITKFPGHVSAETTLCLAATSQRPKESHGAPMIRKGHVGSDGTWRFFKLSSKGTEKSGQLCNFDFASRSWDIDGCFYILQNIFHWSFSAQTKWAEFHPGWSSSRCWPFQPTVRDCGALTIFVGSPSHNSWDPTSLQGLVVQWKMGVSPIFCFLSG